MQPRQHPSARSGPCHKCRRVFCECHHRSLTRRVFAGVILTLGAAAILTDKLLEVAL